MSIRWTSHWVLRFAVHVWVQILNCAYSFRAKQNSFRFETISNFPTSLVHYSPFMLCIWRCISTALLSTHQSTAYEWSDTCPSPFGWRPQCAVICALVVTLHYYYDCLFIGKLYNCVMLYFFLSLLLPKLCWLSIGYHCRRLRCYYYHYYCYSRIRWSITSIHAQINTYVHKQI